MLRYLGWRVILVMGIGMGAAGTAVASPPPMVVQSADDGSTVNAVSGPFGFLNNLERTGYLLGDMWGLRPLLSRGGITLTIQETSEVLGNVTGGSRRTADYDGLTQFLLQLDTQRAFGWYGGLLNVSAEQIHGRNLSADSLQSLQTASGVESDRATRLWELWYQQKFLDENRLDIRVGQQSLDQEFMASQNAAVFVNTMFGWPMLPSADLPGGGPAYPLAALGVRVHVRPIDQVNILMGVFNGNPASSANGDAQMVNRNGLGFPLNGGALYIAELQYAYPSLGTLVGPDEADALSRVYKIGFWYNTENFADQRYGTDGLSLANPNSNGIPRQHRGDYSIYGMADRMVWRSTGDPDRNVSVFFRAMGTPMQDRNLINFSVNAGVTLHEPFVNRRYDTFGLGVGYASVSRSVTEYSEDVAYYGTPNPKQTNETFLEATYQYHARPWWQIQPDIQYVIRPGAGVINPNNPNTSIKNELVLGLRTNILF